MGLSFQVSRERKISQQRPTRRDLSPGFASPHCTPLSSSALNILKPAFVSQLELYLSLKTLSTIHRHHGQDWRGPSPCSIDLFLLLQGLYTFRPTSSPSLQGFPAHLVHAFEKVSLLQSASKLVRSCYGNLSQSIYRCCWMCWYLSHPSLPL